MDPENQRLLVEGAKSFGLSVDEKITNDFALYLKELFKWNQKINLTAIRTEEGVVLKHFLDSLSVHPYLLGTCRLLDIGSGAGFPGIPLKMVEPSLEVTLMDSVRKKVDFQRHLVRTLGLKGIEAIHGRAQDREVIQKLEGRFDAVISRAFSDLRTLLSLSAPFLGERGRVLAMKGEMKDQDLRLVLDQERGRYRLQTSTAFLLPFTTFKRTILIFEKQ